MDWVSRWWHDEVLDGYKGPLLLSFVGFVLTFIAVPRWITRMIRAGKGPFHDISERRRRAPAPLHARDAAAHVRRRSWGSVAAQPLTWWTYLAAAS